MTSEIRTDRDPAAIRTALVAIPGVRWLHTRWTGSCWEVVVSVPTGVRLALIRTCREHRADLSVS